MASDKKTPHDPDTQQVTFWIKKTKLGEWDAFVDEYGGNRSGLIINGVNEFIENHSKAKQPNNMAEINKRFQELQETLTKTVESKPEVETVTNDPRQRERVLKLLELKAQTSEELASLLDMDEMTLVKMLADMKKSGLVEMNKKGEWHVIEE